MAGKSGSGRSKEAKKRRQREARQAREEAFGREPLQGLLAPPPGRLKRRLTKQVGGVFDKASALRGGRSLNDRAGASIPWFRLQAMVKNSDSGEHELCPVAWVQSMSDEAICTRLAGTGVVVEPAGFGALVQRHWSAVELAEVEWIGERALRAQDGNFARAAACVLWERWAPDVLFVEAVVACWQKAWDLDLEPCARELLRMQPLLRALMKRQDTFGEALLDDFVLLIDPDDLACRIVEVALQLAEDGRFALAGQLESMLRELVVVLEGELAPIRQILEADRGELLWAMGERDEAERVLLETMERWPRSAAGYVTLADVLTYGGAGSAADLERAIALLERAAGEDVEDGEDFDVLARLAYARALLGEASGPA